VVDRIELWKNESTDSDDVLQYMWSKLVVDCLVDVVFYNGRVKTLVDFVLMMSGSVLFVASQEKRPVGFVWFDNMSGVIADIHFCFFKEVWDGRTATDVLDIVIEAMFEHTDLSVLLGKIEAKNRAAIMTAKRLGAREVGTLSNGLQDVTIVELTKEAWKDGQGRRGHRTKSTPRYDGEVGGELVETGQTA
jgi:RimJ/RimL family protein N-acetyltransferase